MLPTGLKTAIERQLSQYTSSSVQITQSSAVSGGSINNSFLLHTSTGKFFMKHNDANRYPRMFELEAHALQLMRDTQTITVPQVIGHGAGAGQAFILLEYLEKQPRGPQFWQQFGQRLAAMHRHTRPQYGLEEDNYMGSLPQDNTPADSWTDFFVYSRLEPQVALATDNGLLPGTEQQQFQQLYSKLPDLLPEEPPSLIHGDLWSGNFMCGPKGEACIFDPALYYGHREAEIAMTTLFGGYDAEFYEVYHQAWPLQPGWRQRLDIYNLYPLLIHLNLFGSSYLSSMRSILRQYG